MSTDRPRRSTKPNKSYIESESEDENDDKDAENYTDEDEEDIEMEGVEDDSIGSSDIESIDSSDVADPNDDGVAAKEKKKTGGKKKNGKTSGSKRKGGEKGVKGSGIGQYEASMEKMAASIEEETETFQSKLTVNEILASAQLQLEKLQIGVKENEEYLAQLKQEKVVVVKVSKCILCVY